MACAFFSSPVKRGLVGKNIVGVERVECLDFWCDTYWYFASVLIQIPHVSVVVVVTVYFIHQPIGRFVRFDSLCPVQLDHSSMKKRFPLCF